MKKIILSTITAMALTTSASAFMGIGVEVGAGVWQPELAGDVNYNGSTIKFDDLGIDDEVDTSNNYMYLNFTHFVPIIPNARIEKLNYSVIGNTTLDKKIEFNDVLFNKGEAIKSEISMTQVDYIAYWSVPLLKTASLGVLDVNYGLDIKQLTGSIKFNDQEKTFDESIPLFYVSAIVDFPAIPVDFYASIKTLSYDGTKISDNEIKASIDLPIPTPLIDFKLDIGYKTQNITISDNLIKDFNAQIDTSGLYLGINAKF